MGLLYIIRHGKPEFNGEKRCIGITDLPLSLEGKEQMQEVRRRLTNAHISQIFVSPLTRTLESAKILSGGTIPMEVIPELLEIHMGVWENLPFSQIRRDCFEEYEARGKHLADYKPKGGESFRECQTRACKVYQMIRKRIGGNAAIVAHAGWNRALISYLEHRDLNLLMEIPQPYGHIYTWDMESNAIYTRGRYDLPTLSPVYARGRQ